MPTPIKISDWYELVNRDSKSVWTLYVFQLGERGDFLGGCQARVGGGRRLDTTELGTFNNLPYISHMYQSGLTSCNYN